MRTRGLMGKQEDRVNERTRRLMRGTRGQDYCDNKMVSGRTRGQD